MPGGKRLWRTKDGKLVFDGDPKAVFLAYGQDDRLEGDDKMPKGGEKPEPEPEPEPSERPDGRASAEKWLAYAESVGVTVPAKSREDKAAVRALVEEHEKAAEKDADKQAEKAADKQADAPANK